MDDGWDAVLKGGGWPALMLSILVAIIKGPDLFRSILRSWTGEEVRKEDRLDQQQEAFWSVKDRELDRLRTENSRHIDRNDKLSGRIGQLMASIMWWRDYAGDMRFDRLADRNAFEAYERLHGLEPLVLPDIPLVPRVSEEDTADQFSTKPPEDRPAL